MDDSSQSRADDDDTPTETLHLFVDEAGTPTLFHSSGKTIVDTEGCSRFFVLGKLDVDNPHELANALNDLRTELLADSYFAGVESFRPERKKTALQFHAKDDLPEVRFLVFRLLRSFGNALRFHAVVCDKQELLKVEIAKRQADPAHRFKDDSIYDDLMRSLFAKFHRLADRYELCVAKRGNRERNHAIQTAIERAEDEFESKFGFRRGQNSWTIKVSNPTQTVCLQAVDYFLWAVQRFYEVKRDVGTQMPIIDAKIQMPIREDRFVRMLWPQIGEIHDLNLGPSQGTFFTARRPLTLAERFPAVAQKKKKP